MKCLKCGRELKETPNVNGEYNEFHHTVEYDGSINIDKLIQDLKEWLKSLKDKVQPQPKKEWSEEDEAMYEVHRMA